MQFLLLEHSGLVYLQLPLYNLHVCLCILYILSLQLHSQATCTAEYLYMQWTRDYPDGTVPLATELCQKVPTQALMSRNGWCA